MIITDHPLSNVNNFNISILNFVDIALMPMWPKFPHVINMAVHIQIEFNQEAEKKTLQCSEPIFLELSHLPSFGNVIPSISNLNQISRKEPLALGPSTLTHSKSQALELF